MHLYLFSDWPKMPAKNDISEQALILPIHILSITNNAHFRRGLAVNSDTQAEKGKKFFAHSDRKLKIIASAKPNLSSVQATAIMPPQNASTEPHELNVDVRKISMSMKEDFEKSERFSIRPAESRYIVLQKKIAESATTIREGTREEHKFQSDGRPVTKVITPFGTYCIRHRKPGESPELVPPSIPVTCGNL
jgi:hypothetical protein